MLKGEAANTNLIVWFEPTKDRVHDLSIEGKTYTTDCAAQRKEENNCAPFFVIYKPTPYWCKSYEFNISIQ